VTGKRRRGRAVNGILLLDKPSGMRSNAALQRIKWLFQARKAGHTGSLDSLASGLLPICFGEATKLSGFLLEADKRYRSRFRLGVTTTTGDADGVITAQRSSSGVTRAAVLEALAAFTGEVSQIPPMYSALKHQGRRLYELAYQGVEVAREPRTVQVREFELVAIGDGWIEVEVLCSKGTYVRTLAEDVGTRLGCGAHVETLRRTQVGPFPGAQMLDMDALEARAERGLEALDASLLPLDLALQDRPDVELEANSAFYLQQGQAVLVPRAPTAGLVRLYSTQRRFLGVGEVLDDGRVAPRRLLDAR
jgi:tRNA pseudouridine55 synthase